MKIKYFPSSLAVLSGISLAFLVGCSQNNQPSQSEVQESLQDKLPDYSKVLSFQIEKSENLGTETEPKIQARFKADITINEDLFKVAKTKDFELIRHPLADKAEFISKVTSEGETFKLYGLSVSEQYAENWKTDFKFEENPFRDRGVPRWQYLKRTVVVGSEEENKYKKELEKETIKYREDTTLTLFSKKHDGYLKQGWNKHPFTLDFTAYDEESGNLEGTISYKGFFGRRVAIVKKIKGKLSNSKINFTTTGFVSGEDKDTWGLGTEFLIDMGQQMPRQKAVLGSWKHPGQSNGEMSIQLN